MDNTWGPICMFGAGQPGSKEQRLDVHGILRYLYILTPIVGRDGDFTHGSCEQTVSRHMLILRNFAVEAKRLPASHVPVPAFFFVLRKMFFLGKRHPSPSPSKVRHFEREAQERRRRCPTFLFVAFPVCSTSTSRRTATLVAFEHVLGKPATATVVSFVLHVHVFAFRFGRAPLPRPRPKARVFRNPSPSVRGVRLRRLFDTCFDTLRPWPRALRHVARRLAAPRRTARRIRAWPTLPRTSGTRPVHPRRPFRREAPPPSPRSTRRRRVSPSSTFVARMAVSNPAWPPFEATSIPFQTEPCRIKRSLSKGVGDRDGAAAHEDE